LFKMMKTFYLWAFVAQGFAPTTRSFHVPNVGLPNLRGVTQQKRLRRSIEIHPRRRVDVRSTSAETHDGSSSVVPLELEDELSDSFMRLEV
jgi:hypothetical protein